MPYWYNLRTNSVQEHDDRERARGAELMGPYDTRAEAEKALETARQRTEQWDEEDRKDDEWETGDPDPTD